MIRLTAVLLAALMLTTLLTGCTNEMAELRISGDTYLYIPSITGDCESEITSEPETVLMPETTNVSEDTIPQINESTVYWVAGGKVWHTDENCKSLSRSKNIESGTADDAAAAGKERVCGVCGG